MKRKTVAVLPGDGIGPEVLEASLPVLDALDLPIDLEFGDIGWKFWQTEGNPVPGRTWDLIARSDATLLGATTTKPPREALAELAPDLRGNRLDYISPIIQLRQRLDLFANLRPVENYRGDGRPFRFCVVRENTEGLYAGLDFAEVPNEMWSLLGQHPNARQSGRSGTTASIRLQTEYGLDRILEFAFRTALEHGYNRVTLADKPNVLRHSSAVVRHRLEVVADRYPGIEYEVLNVDAVALWMVRRPERFGVVVAENMFGDILSDLSAGVMGGLGLAPSANIGLSGNYFEPVHGSAPSMAGENRANPAAAFLTLGLMLSHLGFKEAADDIQASVRHNVRRRHMVTYDLGGTASTSQAAQAIIQGCLDSEPQQQATTTIVTIGDELLRGEVADSNATEASRLLSDHGFSVRTRRTAGDDEDSIEDAVRSCLGTDALVVVMGGLGPTSDDVTRPAVAKALGLRLVHREEAWQGTMDRLHRFGVSIHKDNRRQALFPEGAALLPNLNGTAWGCLVEVRGTTVLMLPGPPLECMPMLEAVLTNNLMPEPSPPETTVFRRTLGLLEADAAALVDHLVQDSASTAKVSYRWHYPYVDIRLSCPPEATERLTTMLDAAIGGHLVTKQDRTALQELSLLLKQYEVHLEMQDSLTDGAFSQEVLHSQPTVADPAKVTAALTGSWVNGDRKTFTGTVNVTCRVSGPGKRVTTQSAAVPHRGPEVLTYFSHFAAWSIARHLIKEFS